MVNTKHTFWSLCKSYDKIEIPIIQRDYAQGRDTPEVKRIRDRFVNQYLIGSILTGSQIELDFVYGSVLPSKNDEKGIFIPLDGQQRLSTLFLLHWFIALKEGVVIHHRDILKKFSYETRPSAHDFCLRLINQGHFSTLTNIRTEITESEWYDDEWDHDPTVKGMLNMLHTFASNKELVSHPGGLLDELMDEVNPLISFYFVPLEKFGLTENLYIRMNARGKMLTSFENFKSEFFKIIDYSPELMEDIKDKIEYKWVESLWNYREKDSYIVDKPFMCYLEFITEMLYFKDAKFRADSYYSDFLDLKLLAKVYSNIDNLKFLIFALDNIKLIEKHNEIDLLWGRNSSIHDIFVARLNGKNDTTQSFLLYSTLCFQFQGKSDDHFYDFIRIVRNLVHNTADKSIREWPKLFKSINHLLSDENVHIILLKEKMSDFLDGFYVPQRREEIFKSRIITQFPEAKEVVIAAEDNLFLKGNITLLLASNFVNSEKGFNDFDFDQVDTGNFDLKRLRNLLSAYETISESGFQTVWGDMLITSFYTQQPWARLTVVDDFSKNPSIALLAMDYIKWPAKTGIDDFLRERERKFITRLIKTNPDLSQVRDVKSQLYLYYILHKRIMKKSSNSFFKKGYNFGWLDKEKGFTSIFSKGVDKCQWFPEKNPIFQTYSSQFRYNSGLRPESALDAETVGTNRKKNPFELLIEWAAK